MAGYGFIPGWATRAYNAVFHDPQIQYAGRNQMALQGVPQGGSWGDIYANMRVPLQTLDPVRLGILRSLLAGSGVNADYLSPSSPQAQMIALRGLNPQNIRLGP